MGERPGDEPSLPLTIAAAVDRACDRFEAAWDSGSRPRIEDYLGGVGDPGRSHLFRELLTEDLRRRTAAGETISAEDYRARFPDLAEVVGEVIGPDRGGSRPPMGMELETFVERITDSGLLSAGKLERFVPPGGPPEGRPGARAASWSGASNSPSSRSSRSTRAGRGR